MHVWTSGTNIILDYWKGKVTLPLVPTSRTQFGLARLFVFFLMLMTLARIWVLARHRWRLSTVGMLGVPIDVAPGREPNFFANFLVHGKIEPSPS